MKNYLKLVNFELGRFLKIYLVLAGITILIQLFATIRAATNYITIFNERIYIDGWTVEQFLEQNGEMSLLQVQSSGWFNIPIAFAAAALIFYCFLIWYRDWFGKNTFIYRLFMLPTARLNIYLSKATAIFLMVLGLVALQVLLLVVEGNILKWMVPANLRMDIPISSIINDPVGGLPLGVLIPTNFTAFIIHYGLGFMAVFILFTAILFERSFRLKGIGYGVLYVIVAVSLFFSPVIIIDILQANYLYPVEFFVVELILWAIVTGMSIWVSNYLLNKRITV